MKNHMKEVAKLLGLDLNEVFQISGADQNGDCFWITKSGLQGTIGDEDMPAIFQNLISGVFHIKEKSL